MKAKRQKHKVGKARSITVKAAKKLEKRAGSESESNDVVQTVKPPKKKPKLQPPSSPGKRNPLSTKQRPDDQRDGDAQRRRPRSVGTLAVDKTNPKSKPREKGKKRKEVTTYFVHTIVGSYLRQFFVENLTLSLSRTPAFAANPQPMTIVQLT